MLMVVLMQRPCVSRAGGVSAIAGDKRLRVRVAWCAAGTGFKRDIAGAMARRMMEKNGVLTQEDVDRAKSDKLEAMRLAQLIYAASARGAAPAPPGKGGAAPPQPAKSAGMCISPINKHG